MVAHSYLLDKTRPAKLLLLFFFLLTRVIHYVLGLAVVGWITATQSYQVIILEIVSITLYDIIIADVIKNLR